VFQARQCREGFIVAGSSRKKRECPALSWLFAWMCLLLVQSQKDRRRRDLMQGGTTEGSVSTIRAPNTDPSKLTVVSAVTGFRDCVQAMQSKVWLLLS